MFADQIPSEEPTTLASLLPVVGWSAVAVVVLVVVLVVAWSLYGKYGAPHFGSVPDLVRGLLVKRTHAAAPVVEEGGTPAAPAAAPTPPPAATGVAPAAAPPPPIVQHPATNDTAPAWLPKALVVIAAVPTVLALPWAAYAVSQHLPVPHVVALPLGVLFDVAMVGAVLVALLVPSVSRQASTLGWVAAFAAAVAIGAYTGLSGALVFAATPLISKALWGLLIIIRRQQAQQRAAHAAANADRERREADERAAREAKEAEEAAAKEARETELSEELTFEQQRQVAEKKRLAKFKKDMSAAERELEKAESDAEHQKALAEIKRLGEQQRAEDAEAAAVFEQRVRLERQLSTLKGDAPAFLARAVPAEDVEVVPEITAKAGFGSVSPPAFGFQRPLDVKALTPEGATVKFEDLPDHHQALVKYVHLAKEPSLREAGRKLNKDARTIGRWVEKLEPLGYEFPFGREK